MQTQRDHVHAYQTMVGRMSSALLLGDTNYSEAPARRAVMGLVFGLVLALLIGVGFWVYGLLNPGGNMAWAKPNTIVVEKESGALYVHRNGALVPVLNHASAKLMLGSGAKVTTISRASITDVPRGSPVGIPGAPASVPDPGSLVSGPWLLCLPRNGGGGLSLNLDPQAAAIPVAGNEYLWVTSPTGRQYAVWNNHKMPLADPSVPVVLGLGFGTPVAATPEWLGALPDGPEIKAASVPGGGNVTIAGAARETGTVFVQKTGNGAEHHFVLRPDGLAPISATEAALMRSTAGRPAVDIDAVSIAAAPRSPDRSLTARLPDLALMTAVPAAGNGFCLQQRPQGPSLSQQAVIVNPPAPGAGEPGRISVHVKPGTGLLAAAVPAPTGKGVKPVRYLITDEGLKYRLFDDEAITALGFGGIQPQPVAAEVLTAIPNGPTLSRQAVA